MEQMMEEIAAVMLVHPELTTRGWLNPRDPDYARERADMTTPTSIEQFRIARNFISENCTRRKTVAMTITKSHSSYGWKHIVEAWTASPEGGGRRAYISNGMFIAAALSLGIAFKRRWDLGPNCFFGLSTKWRSPAHRTMSHVAPCRTLHITS